MKKPFFITLTCSAHTLNLLVKNLEIPGVTVHAIKVTKYFRNKIIILPEPNFKNQKLINYYVCHKKFDGIQCALVLQITLKITLVDSSSHL